MAELKEQILPLISSPHVAMISAAVSGECISFVLVSLVLADQSHSWLEAP